MIISFKFTTNNENLIHFTGIVNGTKSDYFSAQIASWQDKLFKFSLIANNKYSIIIKNSKRENLFYHN